MTQWIKVLGTKASYLSAIPRFHMVRGENQFTPVVL